MMFTKEELQFIYETMDQISVRGEVAKATVLQIMVKIRPALQEVPEDGKVKDRLAEVTE